MQRNILIVIGTIKVGGAQRVMTHWARHWAAQGHRVSVLSFDDAATPLFFPLDERVERVSLGAPRWPIHAGSPLSFLSAARQIALLRRALRARLTPRPFVVSLCTYYNLVALVASIGLPAVRIVTDHNFPTTDSPLLRLARPVLYPLADRFVVLTEATRRFLPFWLRRRMSVIPNPAAVLPAAAPAARAGRPFVLGVGRLSKLKRFDLLLDAFAALKDGFPDWDLKIAGDGPLRSDLDAQIRRLGLSGRAFLLGDVPDVFPIYRAASLFVLSSDNEGFPMVLVEAMAAGLPVIATDYPSGPRGIIRDGVDGRIVPVGSAEALARAMRALMADPDTRDALGGAAPEVVNRFRSDRVMSQWDDLFRSFEGQPS